MRPFAVVEGMLIASLAVALIAKPKPRVIAASPALSAPSVKMIVGEVRKLGEGTIHSWVRTTDGRPAALGVTFTESALVSLPTGNARGATETNLALPMPLASFNRIAVKWNGNQPGTFDFRLVGSGEESLSIAGSISKILLESKPNVTDKLTASQPVSSVATSYLVKYEPRTREYTVALEGLKK